MMFIRKRHVHNFKNQPQGTEDMVKLSKINVPEDFLSTSPKKYKMDKYTKLYEESGQLDKPISVMVENNKLVLVNGYIRFLIASHNNLSKVPVKYITQY